ncbi:hypothetical protein K502DRAFT_363589 [Neoconidiobolus thromboides FSU 785]|nr:hypothetical protein K502DRAFT_363589 [Neoconidiobolus thromboides FSU 785]
MTIYLKEEELPFKEIVTDEEERGLELMEVVVADIEAKNSSQFLKFQKLHLKSQQSIEHLKRFRKKEESNENVNNTSLKILTGILCSLEDYSLEFISQKIEEEKTDFTNIYLIKVPKYAPLNRKQFDESRVVWPINYHENPTRTIKFTQQQVDFICKIMKKVMDNGPHTISNKCCQRAIIVDPKLDKVLTDNIDTTRYFGHPLKHSIMNAIDSISQQEQSRRKENNKRKGIDSEIEINYLCQNLDFYLISEPCVMCSMALTHSRVRYVFFKYRNETIGALGSKVKIHNFKGLNHHYRVFVGNFELNK